MTFLSLILESQLKCDMATAEQLVPQLLALPDEDRAWAAEQLLDSLPEEYIETDPEEIAECDRRLAELERDPEKYSVSHEELVAYVDERRRQRRGQ